MKSLYAASVMALALVAAPTAASAAALSVTGSLTTSDPTFNRPGFGTPPTTVDSGTYRYDAYTFSVSTSGRYSGTLTSPTFDNVLGLYAGSFNPSSPLTNVLIYDDDSGPGVDAFFEYDLVAGQQYVAVVTHYYGTDSRIGNYTLVFDGVGAVNTGAVPEPATWAMMILGFGFAGTAMRRRRTSTARISFA